MWKPMCETMPYGFAPTVGENPDDEYELVLGVDPEDRWAEQKAAALRQGRGVVHN